MHSGGYSTNISSSRFGLYLSFALSLQPQTRNNAPWRKRRQASGLEGGKKREHEVESGDRLIFDPEELFGASSSDH